jgi:hypothetical protein
MGFNLSGLINGAAAISQGYMDKMEQNKQEAQKEAEDAYKITEHIYATSSDAIIQQMRLNKAPFGQGVRAWNKWYTEQAAGQLNKPNVSLSSLNPNGTIISDAMGKNQNEPAIGALNNTQNTNIPNPTPTPAYNQGMTPNPVLDQNSINLIHESAAAGGVIPKPGDMRFIGPVNTKVPQTKVSNLGVISDKRDLASAGTKKIIDNLGWISEDTLKVGEKAQGILGNYDTEINTGVLGPLQEEYKAKAIDAIRVVSEYDAQIADNEAALKDPSRTKTKEDEIAVRKTITALKTERTKAIGAADLVGEKAYNAEAKRLNKQATDLITAVSKGMKKELAIAQMPALADVFNNIPQGQLLDAGTAGKLAKDTMQVEAIKGNLYISAQTAKGKMYKLLSDYQAEDEDAALKANKFAEQVQKNRWQHQTAMKRGGGKGKGGSDVSDRQYINRLYDTKKGIDKSDTEIDKQINKLKTVKIGGMSRTRSYEECTPAVQDSITQLLNEKAQNAKVVGDIDKTIGRYDNHPVIQTPANTSINVNVSNPDMVASQEKQAATNAGLDYNDPNYATNYAKALDAVTLMQKGKSNDAMNKWIATHPKYMALAQKTTGYKTPPKKTYKYVAPKSDSNPWTNTGKKSPVSYLSGIK